ncbi:hypothetical protein ACFW6V_14230 [Streptomyces sp. NPDC058734]|uniref:hypothetical protein n=1 Tax=Streptomyces sp. NPDC058734 TaxID=3346615 RepID=UPI0036AC9098
MLEPESVHPDTGRTGTVATVLVLTSKPTGRTISQTTHMRPPDRSGREWTTDPREPEPLRLLATDMPAGAR